jgi:hypothetical protein
VKRITPVISALVILLCSGLAFAEPAAKKLAEEPSGLDTLGGILAMIILAVGGLVLGALALMMIIGAIAPKRSEITSWPAQQEGMFMPFNMRTAGSQSQAWMVGIIVSVVVFIFVVGVKFGVTPDIREVKGMNMSNLTKKESAAPAPKVEPKKEEPKAEAPKEEPKKEEPKAEEKK